MGRDLPGPSVGSALPASRAPGIQISIGRLPDTNRDLFGREKELAWLDACWRDNVRVATVVAWGGAGKSALVNAWLQRLDADHWREAQRVFGWSFFHQGTEREGSSEEFFAAALHAFGDREPLPTSPWMRGQRLAELVRKERALLVLDGLEPLQWGPGEHEGKLRDDALVALLKELAAQNRGMCLVTSRIGVTDLQTFTRTYVREHRLGHLDPAAGALLLRALGVEGPETELRAASTEYDGHALALHLLGTYLRKAHGRDIHARAQIPPLAASPAERMFARYEHWFAGRPELAFLGLLGLFDRPAEEVEIDALLARPPIPELAEDLAALRGAGRNEVIWTLRDVGLLAPEGSSRGKLDAHPLVREHFGRRLARENPEAWREGHRRLFVHLAQCAPHLPETIEDMAPLFAAVTHGCAASFHRAAFAEVYSPRIARGEQYYASMSLGAIGLDLAALACFFEDRDVWTRVVPTLDRSDQAWLLNAIGYDLRASGRAKEALAPVEMGLALREDPPDVTEAAHAAGDLGELRLVLGHVEEAIRLGRKAVALAFKGAKAKRRCSRAAVLAEAYFQRGDVRKAERLFVLADAEESRIGQQALFSMIMYPRWELSLASGQAEAVLTQVEALRRRRAGPPSSGTRSAQGWLLDDAHEDLALGLAHLARARAGAPAEIDDARTSLEKAVKKTRDAGVQEHLGRAILARASLHLHTGALDDARRDLTEALTLSTRCGFRLHECDAHLGFARLALAEQQPDAARAHLAEARALIADTGYHRRDAELADLEDRARVAAPAP